jgi:hypothetical protein
MVQEMVEKSAKKLSKPSIELILRDRWGNDFYRSQRRGEKHSAT